jgi:peptidoglycan/xylan/chitin deacetylase (PgdA/CDA1 family)
LADHVIATNESYKRTQKERCGLDESRITVVRNGPQAETFKPCDPDDYLAAVGRHIICYAGVTNGPDGADLLLHSAAYLVNELGRKDVLFVVIGNGDAMPQLQQLVVDLALEPYIWMTGWVSDRARLLRYLSAADICVAPEPANPYNDSSTMVKIVEYMAMAKPIVAFDLPEHRFSAGDAALYVAGDGPEHFARAIDELLRDRARRSAMGMIGRLRVESRLSWEHSAVHLVDAYERVRARKKNAEVRLRLFNRSPKYLTARLRRLLGRYSLRPQKAMNRVHACVASLATRKCRPTFAVPGRVVASRPEFFQSLQDRGVELAIHGFDHVDFRTLSDREADEQLLRATNAFRKAHVSVSGIRCPYLSGTPQLISRLATDPFLYSSNQSISWNGHGQGNDSEPTLSALSELYTPDDARFTVALPHKLGNVLELPISLPDDLQLFDGRGLRGKALAREWMQVIDKIYDRGELCVLMFHPELFYELGDAFAKVLEELNALDPPVWIAQLREVAKWWQERERVSVQCRRHGEQITLKFDISDRATILVRDRSTHTSPRQLVTGYRAAQCREITLRTRQLPFIGCRVGVPQSVITFLKNDGFVVVTGDEADNCVVVVDPIAASRLSARELLEWVDSQNGTLIRIWRWPNGARSAFCMTGDLDALSLKDYAARLFT